MYVSPELRAWLKPNNIGWRSDRRWRDVDCLHHGPPDFKQSAERYEGGMLNFSCIYAMGASVDWILELGPSQIEQRVMELADECSQILESAGATIDYKGSPILAAKFEERDASQLSVALKEKGILTAARHGRLRVSVHFYNNAEDLERLEKALKTLA
jgi:selenocysteine lyase/cysteine desulfurase